MLVTVKRQIVDILAAKNLIVPKLLKSRPFLHPILAINLSSAEKDFDQYTSEIDTETQNFPFKCCCL